MSRLGWNDRWYGQQGGSTALRPLAWVYGLGVTLHQRWVKPQRAGLPVISVGNLTVGGSGKTPLALALLAAGLARGKRVALVSRGYGRRSPRQPRLWLPGEAPPAAEEFGDEPALVARRCPEAAVVVDADRVAAVRRAATAHRADFAVCDDAFQHRRLARDLDVLCVHARLGFGNGRLVPAGPLREPLRGMQRAGAYVLTYADADVQTEELRRRWQLPDDRPVYACRLEPRQIVSGSQLEVRAAPSGAVLAVCAIAQPTGFRAVVQRAGFQLLGHMEFADHHPFGDGELARIEKRRRALGAEVVVTTEKDLVRLGRRADDLPWVALRLVLEPVAGTPTDFATRLVEEALARWKARP